MVGTVIELDNDYPPSEGVPTISIPPWLNLLADSQFSAALKHVVVSEYVKNLPLIIKDGVTDLPLKFLSTTSQPTLLSSALNFNDAEGIRFDSPAEGSNLTFLVVANVSNSMISDGVTSTLLQHPGNGTNGQIFIIKNTSGNLVLQLRTGETVFNTISAGTHVIMGTYKSNLRLLRLWIDSTTPLKTKTTVGGPTYDGYSGWNIGSSNSGVNGWKSGIYMAAFFTEDITRYPDWTKLFNLLKSYYEV